MDRRVSRELLEQLPRGLQKVTKAPAAVAVLPLFTSLFLHFLWLDGEVFGTRQRSELFSLLEHRRVPLPITQCSLLEVQRETERAFFRSTSH
jgi:hypothetical protein